ncbi:MULTISPECIES: hypothetical protein [Chryseobacterium]|jgi:hypothetical protein|nr:hypothetical protein [Chryseobacterium lathyri]
MKQLFLTFFFLSHLVLFSQKKDTSNVNNSIVNHKNGVQKIEIKNEALEKYFNNLSNKKESENSIWETLIPLLIGAFLTLGTQVFFDFRKEKKEKTNQILESKSELEKLIFLIKHNYDELAMHKAHKHYWYAQYQYEENLEKPNENDVIKFYNYHIESGNKAIQTENIIAENFSNFTKEISKIQQLTKQNTEINELYTAYLSFRPQKPKDIMSVNRAELYDLGSDEESKLKQEYEEYIKILNKIKAKI